MNIRKLAYISLSLLMPIIALLILATAIASPTVYATPPIEGTTTEFVASDIVSDANAATSADGARSVFAADMDNDGDIDILSASENDDTIA